MAAYTAADFVQRVDKLSQVRALGAFWQQWLEKELRMCALTTKRKSFKMPTIIGAFGHKGMVVQYHFCSQMQHRKSSTN